MAPFFVWCIIASLAAASSTEESQLRGRRAAATASTGGASTPTGGSSGPSTGGVTHDHSDGSGVHSSGGARQHQQDQQEHKSNYSPHIMAGDTTGLIVFVVLGANSFVCLSICLVMLIRKGKFWADDDEGERKRRASLEGAPDKVDEKSEKIGGQFTTDDNIVGA